ncbi:notch-regulated ankyrin repeat-containing protein [Corvus kubaryi]|uniref:notch-regulated ankyrin repeat-containing protein n=1 Tax=Corvus kubaryi TaxID=68294 RepID=UPI001C05190C|nr:notch-regulated ankyrin repeat-containing protein [Corvus kubaryi]
MGLLGLVPGDGPGLRWLQRSPHAVCTAGCAGPRAQPELPCQRSRTRNAVIGWAAGPTPDKAPGSRIEPLQGWRDIGNTKELQSLLQNMTNCEFNVNSFGPEGQTALHQSVIDGNLELVKLLVKFGADIRLANRDGWSALHIAAFGGHQDIVLYLITKAKYSAGAR